MRKPWVAVVLTLFFPGLGHLYVGAWMRGLFFLLLPFLAVALFTWFATLPSSGVIPGAIFAIVFLLPVIYLFAVLDAWWLARAAPEDYARRWWQNPFVYALAVVVSLVSVPLTTFFLRADVMEAFVIPAASMSPTIQPGDRVLVTKWRWTPERAKKGDILVFRVHREGKHVNYIKRVKALPGDDLRLDADVTTSAIPPKHLWMIGDNIDHSRDSRHFGPVPFRDFVGRARYRFGPPSRFGVLE